jgi:hypothetical protein
VIGVLQAHLLLDREGAILQPSACPLIARLPYHEQAEVCCARAAWSAHTARQCPHLSSAVEWDDQATRVYIADLTRRAVNNGARQLRCAVLCNASKVPARPSVTP